MLMLDCVVGRLADAVNLYRYLRLIMLSGVCAHVKHIIYITYVTFNHTKAVTMRLMT